MKYIFLFTLLVMAACAPALAVNTLPPPIITVIHPTETPTLFPFTETSTTIPSPTQIPYLMYPYTIAGLRERQFTGGEIRILQIQLQTETYTRYLIDYPSDGLTITGILRVPVGDGPFPVIVLNHGYSNRGEYFSGDGTDRAAEYLVERGYITVASDYRTWGGSDISYSFFHTGLVADVMNLIASLPSIPQADVSRIGMWGHSMGGGVTTKILTLESTVRAAVLYAPNSADDADLIARWGYGCIGDIAAGELLETCNSGDIIPDTLSDEIIDDYVASATSPERMREIAPFYHLENVSIPIQIHIGSADGDYIGSTPPEWSYKLNQGLLDAGKDVELFIYDGQRHSFTSDAWFIFMERALSLFDEVLK